MPAPTPSIWSVLLPVIVGAALASVVPVVLALLNRRWALKDEDRREARRALDARREVRRAALGAYLDARSGYVARSVDSFGRARSGERIGHGTPAGDALLDAMNVANKALNQCFIATGRAGARLVQEDMDRLREWHSQLMATPMEGELDELPPPPRVEEALDALLDPNDNPVQDSTS